MIFITGAAGVGKSTAVQLLKNMLPSDKFSVHDIDEGDLWKDDYVAWRDKKINDWIQRSIINHASGVSIILCGIIYPEDVAKAPAYLGNDSVKYILLDAPQEIIRERFLAREGTPEQRSMFNGDRLKRMESKLSRQLEISLELRNIYSLLDKALIIDTSQLNPQQVADAIYIELTAANHPSV